MSGDRIGEDLEDFKDEAYFDEGVGDHGFDSRLLHEPVTMLRVRKPVTLRREDSVTEAVRGMQAEHRGAVIITEDGTPGSRLIGIFTERDVLFRIVDGGRNPATLEIQDVMTAEPESLLDTQTVAEALQLMSVGGFRHVPVVDSAGRPVFMVSVKDVVQFLVDSFASEILNIGGDSTRAREGG
jgi:CBS domain-containing protein